MARWKDVKYNPLLSIPSRVLGCGLAVLVLWVVGFFVLDPGLSTVDLLRLGSGGVVASLGGATAALWATWISRHTHQDLARAEHEARHDALTGLFNRAELFRELENSVSRAKETDTVLGVLFLDLDRFKVVNDSMGHDAGDELLRVIAGRLQGAIRNTDLVARFGGDEFVVVCRGLMTEKSVLAVAQQILRTFTEPVSLHGGNQVISTSVGIAIARPDDVRSGEDLVRDADAAMYKAKNNRTGYAVFDEIQRLQVIDRLDIERDLVTALELNQFVVYYQPIVDVVSRSLYGFEALVRWNHPTRGLLAPGEFLGVAEEAGMMAKIGNVVLREACAQAAVWNYMLPEAHRIRMGVNLSEQQLIDARLPFHIAEVLDWSGIEPSQLVLEITEDVIVDHLDGLDSLRTIRDLGVHLAIDDFGTGQSSLSYVKQFDMATILKIDQSFVRDLGKGGGANRVIVEAVTSIARALNMSLVAEGVEEPEQVDELKALGIDMMQGYLFRAPIPAEMVDPATWFGPNLEVALRAEGVAALHSEVKSRQIPEPEGFQHSSF